MSTTQRIDKWLWHARVGRTRTAAAALVTAGQVRVNRTRVVKPSHQVRPGDVITVATAGRVLVLRIVALAERRGGASLARETYEDLSPPPVPRAPEQAARPRGAGRPTKRDRRRIEGFRHAIPPDDSSLE